MTSLLSNAELLYSMPVVGPTKTTTAVQCVTQPAALAFQLPALSALWPLDKMPGKALKVVAGGTYDAGAVTNLLTLNADTTPATALTAIAGTGAVTWISSTTGMWEMDIDIDCVGVVSPTSTSWFASGKLFAGPGNTPSALGQISGVGGANALGIPSAVALDPTLRYFLELFSTWGTAPTAFVVSKFKVYAEN